MKVRKAVRCKPVGLTRRKLELLNREYNNFQHYLRTGEDKGVYSATRQQGKRTYRKVDPDREYPLVIRKDLMDIRKTDNKLAAYWARIPVHGVRGGVKVALAHQPFDFEEWDGVELVVVNRESKSPEEELVRDLIAIVTSFFGRIYGKRGAKRIVQTIKEECARG